MSDNVVGMVMLVSAANLATLAWRSATPTWREVYRHSRLAADWPLMFPRSVSEREAQRLELAQTMILRGMQHEL